jgi:ubiquinone biosynthesis monooxygenase Coq7
MQSRHYNTFDQLIMNLDQAVRTLVGKPLVTERDNPANTQQETELTDAERTESARLMRINHAGEVAAQALYQGQALTARLETTRSSMEQAAREENDHLDWCEQRVKELDSHTSLLNPLWYLGSFGIGAVAGAIGDKWSLGFIAETERQVVSHLEEHLQRLPGGDKKSRAVVEQMKQDEAQHGDTASASGGVELPDPVKKLMQLASKVMTRTAYWV